MVGAGGVLSHGLARQPATLQPTGLPGPRYAATYAAQPMPASYGQAPPSVAMEQPYGAFIQQPGSYNAAHQPAMQYGTAVFQTRPSISTFQQPPPNPAVLQTGPVSLSQLALEVSEMTLFSRDAMWLTSV